MGIKNQIPAFAYGILIDQTLSETKLYETMNLLIYAFLEKTSLDLPLFEDVLVHFVANNYKEGIPVVVDMLKHQFSVPSVNLLVILKEAFERGLMTHTQYQRMSNSFQTRSIDMEEDKEEIEQMVLAKYVQNKKMFNEKNVKYHKVQNLPYEFKHSSSKDSGVDPVFMENIEHQDENAYSGYEIVEANDQDFERGSKHNNERFIRDFNEKDEPQLIGAIKIFGKGTGDEENPIKLYLEYSNLSEYSEDIEDYTSEEDSSDFSEDKI
jgi:hypothetical protein